MPADCVDYDTINDFVTRDTLRLQEGVAEVLARKTPFMDILGGGTISNDSNQVRSAVQERAVVHASLADPEFTPDVQMCGTLGGEDQTGVTEYVYELATLRGQGPKVCVKTSRTAFKDSYLAAQRALQKGIMQIVNADVRQTLARRSGIKFVCRNDKRFDEMLTGDMQHVDELFANYLPNATISYKALKKIVNFEVEEMLAEPFEGPNSTVAKIIMGRDAIDQIRDEMEVRDDARYLTTGRYKLGEEIINGFTWEGPYRGLAFGVDAQPLRFNQFYTSGPRAGEPAWINPEIGVGVSKGVGARRNPEWINALYECGFVMMSDTFKRLVPERYVGEGSFKFAPQLHMGELEWFYLKDRCNPYGDFGHHIYQIQRAYRPIRPQNVVPFIFQRCETNLNLVSCATSGSSGL